MSLCQEDQELFLSSVSLLTHPFPMQPAEPPSHFAAVWYDLSKSLRGGGSLRFDSSISIFI